MILFAGGIERALLILTGVAVISTGCGNTDPVATALTERLDSLADATLDSIYVRPTTPLWVDGDNLTPLGRSALEALAGAEREGVAPSWYAVAELSELGGAGNLAGSELARLETELTRGLVLFAQDLARGLVASTPFDHGWHLDSPDSDVLPQAYPDGQTLLDRLDALRPKVEQYERLEDVLAMLREKRDRGGWPRVEVAEGSFQVGDSADAVARLRARLEQSTSPEERRLAEESRDRPALFDAALGRSLSAFQARHDIEMDGVLGPETVAALDVPVEDRIAEVELALERWRWLPADLGSLAVVVNTPQRSVHVIQDGAATLSMKAIIGQREWATELFQDEMEEIVVNPYWNVPESILKAETLARALAEEHYLRDNDFEVVDPASEGVVPPESVRWDEVVLDSISPDSVVLEGFPYRVRQKPGERNALGRIKFLFPNEFAIYLHDTPADHLFDSRLRTFSHGCVRVERPLELAHLLVREASSHDPSEVDALLASGDRHVLPLEPVPTYLIYQTVWVDEAGVPTFTPDVYDRNADARRALTKANADGGRALARATTRGARGGPAADVDGP